MPADESETTLSVLITSPKLYAMEPEQGPLGRICLATRRTNNRGGWYHT